MSWPASLGVGVLTAIVAGLVAGLVANQAVGWYRMSSFEGASGYFVVFTALLGAIAGLILGIVVTRLLGRAPDAGFLKALGLSQAIVLVVAGGVAAVSRLLADVPPTLNGRELVLAVELQWPEGKSPADLPASSEWSVRLSALSGRTARVSQAGPLWREDARLDGGRWVVPGAVDVFTSRGRRMLSFEPDSMVGEGFIVPLPGRPGSRELEWSEWLPSRRDAAPDPGRFHYRFRVVPDDQPIRTETVGPFEIAMIASGFGMGGEDATSVHWYASSQFQVRYRDQPVVIQHRDEDSGAIAPFDRMDAVTVVSGPQPALLLQLDAASGTGPWYLVVAGAEALRVEPVATGSRMVPAPPLTADATIFAAARDRPVLRGRIDRTSLSQPGPYLFQTAVLDTRTLSLRPFDRDGMDQAIDRIPPLGIAPDGLSFVRLTWTNDGERYGFVVVDLDGRDPYDVPVDPSRVRLVEIDQVDPAWLLHYFAWRRGADGRDRLVPREGVTPLPYRGVRSPVDRSGYREYRVSPATEGLRAAMVDFLVAEFSGERVPPAEDAFSHEVRIGGASVHVSWRAEDAHVGVWMDRGGDTRLVDTIADRFDSALATGRYDGLFSP